MASYLQEALRQNEENKEEWIIENFRNTEWMENSKHLFICSKPFFVTTTRYACTWKIYLNCVFCQVWPLPALCKVFRDRSLFIFILDTRCAVNFLVISATGTNSTRVRGEMTRLERTADRVPDKLKCQTFEWKTDLASIMSTNHHHLCCQPFWSTIIV